jgi:dolichol-phosphate mannosyltransferase
MENKIAISVVVPVFNEVGNIKVLVDRIILALSSLNSSYEIIFIDDGSTDGTYELLHVMRSNNANIKSIHFSRNFGHQAAINAGIESSAGEIVVTMDADLQHPPELIPKMIEELKKGYDIILTERVENKEKNKIHAILGAIFYRILNIMSDFEIRANVADFNVYSRQVVEQLKQLPEKDRFVRGLVQWVGFTKKYIPYEAGKRYTGVSKYTLSKMIKLAISGITSFSAFPLRLAWWVGLAMSFGSFVYGIFILVDYFLYRSHLVSGWTSIIIVVLFSGGVQLIILGIIGEYLAKMFYEIKGRPLYIIKEFNGIDKNSQ